LNNHFGSTIDRSQAPLTLPWTGFCPGVQDSAHNILRKLLTSTGKNLGDAVKPRARTDTLHTGAGLGDVQGFTLIAIIHLTLG